MKNLFVVTLLSTCSLLSACSSLSIYDSNLQQDHSTFLATLNSYQIDNGFITIETTGYGCTFFNSFEVQVADNIENGLKVVQVNPDKCGMKPRPVSLQYSFKHLGLDLDKKIAVTNPIESSSDTLVKN
ncbi:hypothetical protein FLL45_09290 [Aliikangiella marina]|uniref:Uncharacterized protein n=1 Tax=Aliikangiella marina TaxID=1712262 RepID=A0A545TD59_9GAMM|nr:hypothetical protein [Aliikangiella marina]TQV75121.1 hypothetical protein FLL45_09290 [Aliikangiella marina]